MKLAKSALLACAALCTVPALANETGEQDRDTIVVVGVAEEATEAGTKTDTPVVETPQAITVVKAETYLAQGAVSVGDTLRYTAGVTANPYGPDGRVDGGFVRGVSPLQFRDGMRDIFSYYASVRSDPYNFSQVELVRGPASSLFGSGALGGLLNMVSKTPESEFGGEVAIRYGSFDRKEALADLTGEIAPGLAGRIVARVRDSGTQVDHVPDDRVMIAPSLRWRPGASTEITLIGLYQEDDGGSTSQFLPLVGTIYANPNGQLPNDTFIGKPGWDRYDGRLLQGSASVDHRFSDAVRLSLKARYIDSDLTYLTHYPDNYSAPANPFSDPAQRTMGLYADGSYARMEIFSSDNNIRFDFDTGQGIEHVLLAGVDYSWNRVRKEGGYDYEFIDIYDIDYSALSDFGGGIPTALGTYTEDTTGKQLGFYLQDQIRFFDRVSLVLGARRDHVSARVAGSPAETDNGTTLRAGLIAEIVPGISPFVSYTESFEPVPGVSSSGDPFVPKRGRQIEGGIKFHPDSATLVTISAFSIREKNRVVDDPSTPAFDQMQIGSSTSKGFEIEASRTLPGNFEIIASYGYVKAEASEAPGQQLDNVPKTNASAWGTKTFDLGGDARLRLGGGLRYTGANYSFGPAFPDGVRTPAYLLVDALAELDWKQWRLSINATNLFDKQHYAACLARGDCFIGADRNVFGTLAYRF